MEKLAAHVRALWLPRAQIIQAVRHKQRLMEAKTRPAVFWMGSFLKTSLKCCPNISVKKFQFSLLWTSNHIILDMAEQPQPSNLIYFSIVSCEKHVSSSGNIFMLLHCSHFCETKGFPIIHLQYCLHFTVPLCMPVSEILRLI